MAGLLARNTHGVEVVKNKLEVDNAKGGNKEKPEEESTDVGQSISDTWINTKVKSTLMYSSNVKGSDISVSTKD